LVFEKTKEEAEELKMRKIPVKHIDIQTELNLEEMGFMYKRKLSRDEEDRNMINMNPNKQKLVNLVDMLDKEIECNLI
jgi:hypothetical protein